MLKKKIILPIKFVYSYLTQKRICSYPPFLFYIEPTNFCNLKCRMCPHGFGFNRKKGFMDMKLYRKIINEIKDYAKWIHLYFLGESLLHERIFDMIKYARKHKISVILHTNATLLDEKASKKILDSELNCISFSFTDVSNNKMILNNIMNFVRLKKSMNRGKPTAIVEIINMKDTNDAKVFANLPVKLKIKPIHSWAGNYKKAREVCGEYSPCRFPWYSLTILWDGRVVSCCKDYEGKYIVGNAKKEKINDIWNSKKMTALRERLINGEYSKIKLCKNCDWLWHRKKAESLQVGVLNFLTNLKAKMGARSMKQVNSLSAENRRAGE